MKKILLLVVVAIGAITVGAQTMEIKTKNQTFEGELVGYTDTTMTIKTTTMMQPLLIPVARIISVNSLDGNKYIVKDGKLIVLSKEEQKEMAIKLDQQRMGDPNYAVGKAMKTIGKSSLIIGAPTLAVGTILLGYGIAQNKKLEEELAKGNIYMPIKPDERLYQKKSEYEDALTLYSQKLEQYQQYLKDRKKYSDCTLAGTIMFPIGASLTIIAIPLCIKGNQLMSLNINYNGNGAGVALNF